MTNTMQTVKHTSPYARDEESSDYATDPFWQHEEVKAAVYKYVTQTSPAMSDLRGTSFTVNVSEDGLTVEVTPADA